MFTKFVFLQFRPFVEVDLHFIVGVWQAREALVIPLPTWFSRSSFCDFFVLKLCFAWEPKFMCPGVTTARAWARGGLVGWCTAVEQGVIRFISEERILKLR